MYKRSIDTDEVKVVILDTMKQLYAMLRILQVNDRCGTLREHPGGLVQGCVGDESVVIQRRGV